MLIGSFFIIDFPRVFDSLLNLVSLELTMAWQIVPQSLEVIRILSARDNHKLERVIAPEATGVHATWTSVLMLLYILEVFPCFVVCPSFQVKNDL